MMCEDARPLLDPLYDGALNSKDTAIVLEHLKACVDCGQEWHQMEQLKDRFRSALNQTDIPSTLTNRISAALNKEDSANRSLFLRRCMNTAPIWLVAASLLLVGLFALPNMNNQSSVEAVASIDSLLDATTIPAPGNATMNNSANTQTVSTHDLTEKLGFQPKFISMTGWNMQQASVYERPTGLKMAKFDFANTKYGAPLYCFQSMQGKITQDRVSPIEPTDIAGKSVRFGQRGRLQFALWSQNGRDYLLVTPLPREALTEIVRNA